MNYDKKILVLNQVAEGFSVKDKRINAIFRIEVESGVSTLYLSVINVAAKTNGEFFLHVLDNGKKIYSFPLGSRPSAITREYDFPKNILDGFAAGISFISDGIPMLIAYSECDGFSSDKTEFKKAVARKCMEEVKNNADRVSYRIDDKVFDCAPPKEYDDEAVATENYYLLDKELNEKIKLIESNDYVGNKNTVRFSESQEKTGKSQKNGNGDQSENCDTDRGGYSEQRPYVETARAELNGIFFKFPEESALSEIIPESRWAKINYSSEKYYVVGVINENGKEKYICYGVPAKYSSKPPKELKGFCSFVPLSYFDMKGDGYWMMFQSAITGECVKPEY